MLTGRLKGVDLGNDGSVLIYEADRNHQPLLCPRFLIGRFCDYARSSGMGRYK